MNYEEALKWFEDDMSDGMCSPDCPQCNANMLAIEVLEKQIPQKVRYKNRHGEGIDLHNDDYYHCPSCGRRLRNKQHDPYCGRCGQAIDWRID